MHVCVWRHVSCDAGGQVRDSVTEAIAEVPDSCVRPSMEKVVETLVNDVARDLVTVSKQGDKTRETHTRINAHICHPCPQYPCRTYPHTLVSSTIFYLLHRIQLLVITFQACEDASRLCSRDQNGRRRWWVAEVTTVPSVNED